METEGTSLTPEAPSPASAWLRVTGLLSLMLRPCLTQPRPQKRCQSLSPASYTLWLLALLQTYPSPIPTSEPLLKARSFPSSFP